MNASPLRRGAVAAAVALSLCGAASAATVDLTATLDLSTVTVSPTQLFSVGFTSITPFSLAEGDALSYTVDFAGGQALTMVNPTFAWAFVLVDDGNTEVQQTGTFSFLDAHGNALLTSPVKTDIEGAAHVGQQFGSTDFTGMPPTITFYGVRYDGTVLDYADPAVTTRTYTTPALLLDGADVSVTPVPEPATAALMLAGLGLVGVARLRARRRD